MADVVDLYTAPAAGEPMDPHEQVDIVEGGLVGDRYCRGTGYYSPYDVCEVTLVAAEALETIRAAYDIDLRDGRHRRNIVTRGVDLNELLGASVRIGEAELRGTRPRPPCAHVEEIAAEAGVARDLGAERGGICASVTTPGRVAVGDTVEIVEADPRTVGAEIAERLDAESTASDHS